MAGLAVSPGDWMPATWMKAGTLALGRDVEILARASGASPAKLVITSYSDIDGIIVLADDSIFSSCSRVVARSRLVVDRLGGRADEHGALDRGYDEHALGDARRHGEDDAVGPRLGQAVQQVVLALARLDLEVLGAEQPSKPRRRRGRRR